MRRSRPLRLRDRIAPMAATLLLTAVAVASCSSDDDTTATTAPTTTVAPEPDESTDDETDGDPAPPTTGAVDDAEDGTAEDEAAHEPGEPALPGLGGVVELTTATAGGGARPLLEWAAVDGADHYGVYVYAPDDAIYWVWQGTATAVHVGGADQLPDTAAGPQVTAGMTWAVVAYDAEQLPIASSERRPIAP